MRLLQNPGFIGVNGPEWLGRHTPAPETPFKPLLKAVRWVRLGARARRDLGIPGRKVGLTQRIAGGRPAVPPYSALLGAQ